MKFLFYIFLFLFNSSFIWASSYISTGTYVSYFKKVQTTNSGDTKTFEIVPYVGYAPILEMTSSIAFVPEIGYARYFQNAKKINKDILFFKYQFAHALSSVFFLRYGLSTHWLRISGDGGYVSLRNGSGYTNFKAPSKTRTSYFSTLDLGIEGMIKKDLSLRFDLNFMSIADTDNWATNYLLTLNILFGAGGA